jgi:hypothetical protein
LVFLAQFRALALASASRCKHRRVSWPPGAWIFEDFWRCCYQVVKCGKQLHMLHGYWKLPFFFGKTSISHYKSINSCFVCASGGNRTLFLCFFLALVQASCAFSIFYGNYEGVWRGWFWGVLGGGGACHRSCRRFTFDFSSLHDIRTLCNALLFFAMHWLFFIAWNTDALLRFATLCYALLRIDFSTLLQRVSEKVWSQENSKGTTPHFESTYCAQSHWQTVAQGYDAAESTYVKDQSRTSKHEVFCDVKDELYIIPCNDS